MQSVSNLRVIAWSFAAVLLLLPFIGMQFTNEINWTGADFATFGLMLLLTGGAIEIAVRATTSIRNRIIAAIALIGLFLVVFVELAVGIFH